MLVHELVKHSDMLDVVTDKNINLQTWNKLFGEWHQQKFGDLNVISGNALYVCFEFLFLTKCYKIIAVSHDTMENRQMHLRLSQWICILVAYL